MDLYHIFYFSICVHRYLCGQHSNLLFAINAIGVHTSMQEALKVENWVQAMSEQMDM